MRIAERFFDCCLLIELYSREDVRGSMELYYDKKALDELTGGFEIIEQRVYTIPRKGTFFGIHFQKEPRPQAKLVSVIRGKGMDYVVDLRRDSATYKQYRSFKLDGRCPKAVYIPAGFGHAFLSLEDDTVQLFAADEYFFKELSGVISFKDPGIGLKLPLDELIMSESDRSADVF